MVKTPHTRHSKNRTEPLTIDLEADQVKREVPGDRSGDARTSGDNPGARDTPRASADTAGEETVAAKVETDASPEAAATAAPQKAGTPRSPEPKATGQPPFGRDAGKNAGASPSMPKEERPARAPVLAAGILGGVIALAAGGGLQWSGILPAPSAGNGDATQVETLRGEIAAIRRELAAMETGGGITQQDLADALAAPGRRIDELSGSLEGLKSDLETLRATLESGGGETPGIAAFGQRIDEIEAAIAALRQGADGVGQAELEGLERRTAAVEAGITELRDSMRQAIEVSGGATSRIAAIETRLEELAARVDEQADRPDMAAAIAASSLRSAIDRGSPFTAELDTYVAISPASEAAKELREYAVQGVATRASIALAAEQAAIAMIDAAEPPSSEGGFFARLWESAQSLVKVRPIGDVAGSDVPAIVARIEAAIGTGDYGRAAAEYDTLPDAPKAAGADFMKTVAARDAVDQLVARIMAESLAAS